MPGVLIVEDDNELREMLKMMLLRRNFTVFEAENGKMPSHILNHYL